MKNSSILFSCDFNFFFRNRKVYGTKCYASMDQLYEDLYDEYDGYGQFEQAVPRCADLCRSYNSRQPTYDLKGSNNSRR